MLWVTNYSLLVVQYIMKNYSSFMSDDEQYAVYSITQKIWSSKTL